MQRRIARNAGFTLIEVMVVVVIIAILAANVENKLDDAAGEHHLKNEAQHLPALES